MDCSSDTTLLCAEPAPAVGAGLNIVSAVRPLGAAYRFSDRGLHELKGVPGALQLITVEQSA